MWQTVQQFRDWYVQNGMPIRPPFKNAIYHTDNAMSLCLFRRGRFQVELYLSMPNSGSPAHKHPGVESTFMYLTGNLTFNLEGQETHNTADKQKPKQMGQHEVHHMFGAKAESPDGLAHWLNVGPEGGAFLSFEYWKDRDPTSVTINWEGEPVGEDHRKTLAEKKV